MVKYKQEVATMRRVNIKALRDKLSKELKDLPIAVTSDGQVVATILTLTQYNQLVKGYKSIDSSHKLELYNPARHKVGDRVLVQQGKRLVETTIPKLDGDGNAIPGYW